MTGSGPEKNVNWWIGNGLVVGAIFFPGVFPFLALWMDEGKYFSRLEKQLLVGADLVRLASLWWLLNGNWQMVCVWGAVTLVQFGIGGMAAGRNKPK